MIIHIPGIPDDEAQAWAEEVAAAAPPATEAQIVQLRAIFAAARAQAEQRAAEEAERKQGGSQ